MSAPDLRRLHAAPHLPRSMAGVSLVELMIAMALGLVILAGLASLFASTSASRNELERSSRQIENGRYAMELLADDLRLAGFYGELNVGSISPPAGLADPCSVAPADWVDSMPVHLQGYDLGAGVPACLPGTLKAGTDVIVVRRAATCESGTAGCSAVVGNTPYVQISRCAAESVTTPYVIGLHGSASFGLRLKDCAAGAGLRSYIVRMYFVSTDNGAGQDIPTLKRLDFNGTGWVETPLVEGIEELNVEYGIDWAPLLKPDGNPDAYTTDPSTFTAPGCTTCNATNNWLNAMTARIHLLARNIEPSPAYTDTKTYTLGRDAAGAPVTVTPGGPFKRHAYAGLVRVVNAAQRRETP